MIISVFIPHGGCPERCTFCDQRVSGGTPVSKLKIHETILEHLKTKKENENPVEVAFYGGTFTALSQKLQIEYLNAVKPFIADNLVHGIRIATRPDAIEKDWISFLKKEFSLKTIELGVQSFHLPTLEALGRSHTPENLDLAVSILKELKLKISFHILIGCPKERENEDEHTLKELHRLKPDYVRIHPLLILKDTPLEKLFTAGKFTPLSLKRAVERASFLTRNLESSGIKLIRLGLQPNELLGNAVTSGPYHPAFGELVRSQIVKEAIDQEFKDLGEISLASSIEVLAPRGMLSVVKGQKSSNIQWLRERFHLSSEGQVVVRESASYDKDTIQVRLYNPSGVTQCRKIEPFKSALGS